MNEEDSRLSKKADEKDTPPNMRRTGAAGENVQNYEDIGNDNADDDNLSFQTRKTTTTTTELGRVVGKARNAAEGRGAS